MATISSAGIGSGLDVNSIVTQLVAIEKQPLTQLKSESTSLQTRLSTYGKIQSGLSALRDAAQALTRPDTWSQSTATSSDSTAVAVTTGVNTRPGNYALEVTHLASVQSNASRVYASADALVGEGTLRIELGTWGPGQSSFTPKAGATAVDFSAGPPAQSLAQLRDKINGASAGVTASVLTDASGARLVLRSNATGAENGFRVSVTDTDGTNGDNAGLSALAFDPAASISSLMQAVAAQNASAMLNGLAINSASNTLTDVLDGLSLTLGKVTTAPVQISTAQDNSAIRKSLDTFVSAYNDLNKLLGEQTKYDAATKVAGALQGDSAAVAIRNQMRSALGANSAASIQFTRVSDVGFDVQRDGSIKLDESKLSAGLANIAEMKKLFSTSDTVTPGNNGIATQLRTLGDRLLSVDGTVSTRTAGIRKSIDLNQDRQDQLSTRIDQIEKRLRAQYTALDTKMSTLNALSSYVTQQFSTSSTSKA